MLGLVSCGPTTWSLLLTGNKDGSNDQPLFGAMTNHLLKVVETPGSDSSSTGRHIFISANKNQPLFKGHEGDSRHISLENLLPKIDPPVTAFKGHQLFWGSMKNYRFLSEMLTGLGLSCKPDPFTFWYSVWGPEMTMGGFSNVVQVIFLDGFPNGHPR